MSRILIRPRIRAAASAAMDGGETRYTPTNGTTALRKAVQAKLARENQLQYALEQICIANGANRSSSTRLPRR